MKSTTFIFWSVSVLITSEFTLAAPSVFAAETICPTGTSTQCKPCTIFGNFSKLMASPLFGGAWEEPTSFFFSELDGNYLDANGPFLYNASLDDFPVQLSGDGIMDVANQMRVIEYLIRNSTSELLPEHLRELGADMSEALIGNRLILEDRFQGESNLELIQLLMKPLIPALTYLTLLGSESDYLTIVDAEVPVYEGAGSIGIASLILHIFDGLELNGTPLEISNPNLDPVDLQNFGDILAPEADLDGDGFSNICEYRHFKRGSCVVGSFLGIPLVDSSSEYELAVVNPAIFPTGCYEEVPLESVCTVSLNAGQVVPPASGSASGMATLQKFQNTETDAAYYRLTLQHNLDSATPSVRIYQAGVGVSADTPLVEFLNLSPRAKEIFLTHEQGDVLLASDAYIEVSGPNTDTPTQIDIIRGDGIGSCATVEGEGTAEGTPEGFVEGIVEGGSEGLIEGAIEGLLEGEGEGLAEGLTEGSGEGASEGIAEGATEGSGDSSQSADTDNDQAISLAELLRGIQLFNQGSLGCAQEGTEDGYEPGGEDHACEPHSSDYNPQDWQIGLSELLRLIQFFTSGGYTICPDTEDGYCAGAA